MAGSPSVEDEGPHFPRPEDSDNWQESLAFHFYDPRSRVTGYHHVGLQRKIDRADIWSWLAVEGRMIHCFQHLDLRLPERDFPDFRLGPLGVGTTTPLTGRHVTIEDEKAQLSLHYQGFGDPVHYGNSSGSSGNFAHGHFETLGRAVGELTIDGKVIAVDAWAFDDRSWGERQWKDILTFRFFWANFGSDLHLAVYAPTGPSGPRVFGYLHDRGIQHEVVDVELSVRVASNGLYANGLEAVVWTRDGGGYQLTGRTDGNFVTTQRQGFMESGSPCRMEMNGRVGAGMLEFAELKKPTPEIISRFGLMKHPEDM